MLVVYPINFNNIPSLNFRLEAAASAVTSGPAGRLYLNGTTGFVECWNGATTLILGAPMSTLANANTVALRDGTGGLTASSFNGPLNGNAATATTAANAILLSNQPGSYYLARTNHTGTQLSSTISDLTANIRSTSLDQFAKPATSLDLNQFTILNLHDPVNPQDAVNKRYVDNNVASVESQFLTYAIYDPGQTGTVNYAVTATLLAGVSPSYYLDRSNHTGTQLAATISNFTGAVQAIPLNTLAPATGPITANGQQIHLVGSPGLATDGANKGYIDSAIAAIPPPSWSAILNIPPLRGTFIPLPVTTDTSSPLQTEAEGYDHYYFYSTSGWRRILSIPFRPWVAPPATHTSPGTLGQTAYDSYYFYFYNGASWYRVGLGTWAGGTPFTASAAVPANYIYSDGAYFYIATGVNTWQRFALSTFAGVSAGQSVPTQSYYPGITGMEAMDSAGNWYYCWAQNQWARAAGSSAF
jgi:hypothetical protein